MIESIINMYVHEGIGCPKIAKILGLTNFIVRNRLLKEGITIRSKKTATKFRIPEEVKQNIIKDYLENTLSEPELVKKYNLSKSTLNRRLKEWEKIRSHSEAHRQYAVDEEYFGDVLNEEKLYFLGLLYADGCCTGGEIVLGLIEKDKHILDFYNNKLHEGKKPLTYIAPYIGKEGFTSSPYYRLVIHNQKLYKKAQELGVVERKTFKLTFPDWIPPALQHHFIRGYIDGDGCFLFSKRKDNHGTYNTRIELISTQPFCASVQNILEDNKILSSIKPCNKIYRLNIFNRINLKRTIEYLYKDATIYLPRKKEKADQILEYIDSIPEEYQFDCNHIE